MRRAAAVATPPAGLVQPAPVEHAARDRGAHVVARERDLIGVEVRQRPRGERVDGGVVAVERSDPGAVHVATDDLKVHAPGERSLQRLGEQPRALGVTELAMGETEACDRVHPHVCEAGSLGRGCRTGGDVERAARVEADGSQPGEGGQRPCTAGAVVGGGVDRDRSLERGFGLSPAALAPVGESQQLQRPCLEHRVTQAGGDLGRLLVRSGGARGVVGQGPAVRP